MPPLLKDLSVLYILSETSSNSPKTVVSSLANWGLLLAKRYKKICINTQENSCRSSATLAGVLHGTAELMQNRREEHWGKRMKWEEKNLEMESKLETIFKDAEDLP